MLSADVADCRRRALQSLRGLSVGDAFGESFFINPNVVNELIADRALRDGVWTWTDDTQMALSIAEMLAGRGGIDQDALARRFAARYDVRRGYGPAMHNYLQDLRVGVSWRAAAPALFEGQGSFGNGAAMRVAPIGGYFAQDLDAVVTQAALSAPVTHAHPEAIAGAVAVAVGAAIAARHRDSPLTRPAFLDAVLPFVPESVVRERCRHARDLAPGCSVTLAVAALGNGTGVSAQDTVPFSLWCAGEHLDDYPEALWLTVSGLGDRDTTCAIVGGIVALSAPETIPAEWLARREPLPEWFPEAG